MNAPKKASSNLQRAPRLVVDKERALKFWEESESKRVSGSHNFFKTLRNNRSTIIVAIAAAALIFFRLQEATCVKLLPFPPSRLPPSYAFSTLVLFLLDTKATVVSKRTSTRKMILSLCLV